LNLHGLYCAIHLSFANNLIYGFLQHNLQSAKVQYSRAVDNIMSLHAKGKGIIHTSGIEFHQRNISQPNARRLLVTDPDIQRDEVISQHANAIKPTVLISPSLHTGLDLKNELPDFK